MARRRAARRSAAAYPPLRIGIGSDVHPFRTGRRLILGGVVVPHRRGLAGHSDADVLTHAVCDALLGALGLPDLGQRYPNTDPKLRGRSSLRFLREIVREVRSRGYELINLDSVVLAEAPRLRRHQGAIRRALARTLGCSESRIGLKAKRCEGLGAIGRHEGMMAQAVVLLGPRVPAGPSLRSRRTPGAGTRRGGRASAGG